MSQQNEGNQQSGHGLGNDPQNRQDEGSNMITSANISMDNSSIERLTNIERLERLNLSLHSPPVQIHPQFHVALPNNSVAESEMREQIRMLQEQLRQQQEQLRQQDQQEQLRQQQEQFRQQQEELRQQQETHQNEQEQQEIRRQQEQQEQLRRQKEQLRQQQEEFRQQQQEIRRQQEQQEQLRRQQEQLRQQQEQFRQQQEQFRQQQEQFRQQQEKHKNEQEQQGTRLRQEQQDQQEELRQQQEKLENVKKQMSSEEAEVLIGQIKKMSEESIYWKYFPNMDNINKYQREFTQLICRAVEENQMEAVKQKLSTKKGLTFEMRLSTNTQIPLINRFLAYVDPHLQQLYLYSPSDEIFNSNDFDRWLQVVGNLTNKIRFVLVSEITTSIPTTNLAIFMENIEGRLQIFYRKKESHEKVENMNKIIQNIINKNPLTEMYISTEHNFYKNYIKQQYDPRMTSSNQVSSLITESPINGNRKSLKWIPSSDEMLNNLSRHIDGKGFVFDIFVTTIAEVRKLNRFLGVVKPCICWIELYLPRNSKRNDVKLICDVITGNNAKIDNLELYNLNKSNYHDDVIKLASKVETRLDLRFTDHRSAEEKNVLEARFQSLQSKTWTDWFRLKSKARIDLWFRSDARVINKK